MISLKTRIYKFFEKKGFLGFYLKTLFYLRSKFNLISINQKRLLDFYKFIFPEKVKLIFDIGANVGERSFVFSKISEMVISLEPNPELNNLLKSRFSNSPNVKIINKACSDDFSELEFYLGDNHLVSTFSTDFIIHKKKSGEDSGWNSKLLIQTITLDSLILEYGIPDFCKIDVEGFEKYVIKGLNQKIGMISFEFNSPVFIDDSIWNINKLETIGYSSFNISFGESLEFIFASWISPLELIGFLKKDSRFLNPSYGDIYAK